MIIMSWQYSQTTGQLTRDGKLVATGYAGKGAGKNNPKVEHLRDTGPLPRGRYRIGRPYEHSKLGPHVMNLQPIGHAAHGRTAFRIHGESTSRPGAASDGCIILSPRNIRQQISASGDNELIVVE